LYEQDQSEEPVNDATTPPNSSEEIGGHTINWDAVVGHHVVCLIDVLGIQDQFCNWVQVDMERPETLSPVVNSVFPVCHFQNMFNQFFQDCQQGRGPAFRESELPEHEIAAFLQCTEYMLGTQWFSDTFVFYAPTSSSGGDLSTVPVFYFLIACCLAMLDSLASGHPVRGALCVGEGVELSKHNFFGPAFAQAYHIESECAGYPRVVVSPETLAFVKDVQHRVPTDTTTLRMKGIAGLCDKLVTQDTDGHAIVDYMGEGISEYVTENADREQLVAIIKAGYEFAQHESRRFRDKGNALLAGRYQLLCGYMESRLPLWGIVASD